MIADTIHDVLRQLGDERRVFCSEADFQHALAWQLHHVMQPSRLRLEYPLDADSNERLDIWLEAAGTSAAVELKYKSRGLIYQDAGVEAGVLRLRNQAAQDLARYDFLKDVMRLERYVRGRPYAAGYAIFLTNDASYWKRSAQSDTCDAAFRIHDGGDVQRGELRWQPGTAASTMAGRERPITLAGAYHFRWSAYAAVPGAGHGEFRYLLEEVDGQRA
jgi:hypothetical protein